MWGAVHLSGGAAANFDYVQASSYANLPASPDENTFGLITSVTIPSGGFSIRSKVPSSGMAAGDVVLIVDSGSSKIFEVATGSKVYAYPVAAYQYVGGVWVSLEAYIYQASAWGTIWVYYYKDGSLGIISGFQYGGTGSFSNTGGELKLTGTGAYESWCFNEAVNLTNFNVLKFEYSAYTSNNGQYAQFWINPSQTLMDEPSFPTATAYIRVVSGTPGSYGPNAEIDISGLSGSYKVHAGCYMYSGRTIDFRTKKIWVE